uniref:Uncharacterized protein n=1 Tax=Plectus sambesii TaxID=2011161 RepID=A0A914UTB6_9BILA
MEPLSWPWQTPICNKIVCSKLHFARRNGRARGYVAATRAPQRYAEMTEKDSGALTPTARGELFVGTNGFFRTTDRPRRNRLRYFHIADLTVAPTRSWGSAGSSAPTASPRSPPGNGTRRHSLDYVVIDTVALCADHRRPRNRCRRLVDCKELPVRQGAGV